MSGGEPLAVYCGGFLSQSTPTAQAGSCLGGGATVLASWDRAPSHMHPPPLRKHPFVKCDSSKQWMENEQMRHMTALGARTKRVLAPGEVPSPRGWLMLAVYREA